LLILQPVETPAFVGPVIKMTPPAPKLLSLSELEQTAVHPRVLSALREISSRLSAEGVRHGVLGALAVGIHGWPRATRDVDLLVASSPTREDEREQTGRRGGMRRLKPAGASR
jgi:hypothetical protein